MTDPSAVLGPQHDALLFAWLAQTVFDRLDDAAAAALLEQAIVRYGEERGHRMAIRAERAGESLDFRTYLAYGEWRAPDGASAHQVLETSPSFREQVTRCPWHKAWAVEGLLAYGQHYCRHIDRALVSGFNPSLLLEVNGTLSGGDPHCEFVFVGADLSQAALVAIADRKRALTDSAVMPWAYHIAHLLCTMGKLIENEVDGGGLAVQQVLDRFEERFGRPAIRAVLMLGDTDFARA